MPDCYGPCLYHATYRRHLRGIMQHGLGAASVANFTISKSGVVYLTNDPDVAENYAREGLLRNLEADDIIILQVDQRQLDPAKLHEDPNDVGDMGREPADKPPFHPEDEGGYDTGYTSYAYHGVIPPAALSVWS